MCPKSESGCHKAQHPPSPHLSASLDLRTESMPRWHNQKTDRAGLALQDLTHHLQAVFHIRLLYAIVRDCAHAPRPQRQHQHAHFP